MSAPILIQGIVAGALIVVGIVCVFRWGINRKPSGTKQSDKQPSPSILYEDRGSLTKFEGKLTAQIEQANHVWISCFTGSTLEQSDALGMRKITKLILYDPSYELLKVYAAMEGNVNKVHAYRSNIVSITKHALDNDVSVYWAKRPLINLVIANADSAKDEGKWAKIETFLPYQRADERPSYIITKAGFPELYLRLTKSFNAIAENAETTINVNTAILAAAMRLFNLSLTST